MDPTTFNKSKRITKEGKQRWPSTESLAKVLNATGASLGEFVSLIEAQDGSAGLRRLPKLRFAQAAQPGYFDATGRPVRAQWEETSFPDIADPHAYALEVTGEGLLPVYRHGDLVVVSPETRAAQGDRVLVRTQQGEMLIAELQARSEHELLLKSLGREQATRSLASGQVQWVSRIAWSKH
ncbi:S24 family peptidase [Pelagibius sp.]|uniref:S24 family peptidase n=1 Tax=Pelagibius sp. TaxID=1931238 RepID=UPI003BAA4CC9